MFRLNRIKRIIPRRSSKCFLQSSGYNYTYSSWWSMIDSIGTKNIPFHYSSNIRPALLNSANCVYLLSYYIPADNVTFPSFILISYILWGRTVSTGIMSPKDAINHSRNLTTTSVLYFLFCTR